jgi:asparagine synthase (glutamine-hydrolysing)
MCGIAGIIRSDGRPVDMEVLERMSARLTHRGPDQSGIWVEGELAGGTPTASAAWACIPADREHAGAKNGASMPAGTVGLAVRRLAVIDPAGGRQPLASEDASVWLAYNGEIYNYRELRAGLAAHGHTLRSAGDSEVLVHLYEDHGAGLLGRLTGMFALAIWDARRRRLLVARDRLGQKPLYWWHGPGAFVFASEVAALLECPDVPRQADRPALGQFLRFGYVPAPLTGFAAIRKLPPAHYLLFDAATGAIAGPTRYWDIPRGPADLGPSPAEWRERLREVLSEAVQSQLVADVPLGVLLSGGLDSSAVAALAAAHSQGPLRTFTVRFAETGWDESGYAREAARHIGASHTELPVRPRCVEALGELVERHGEPFADSSSIAMYYLGREARRHVTVALSGDGGDESFGGYPRHAAMAVSERLGPRLRRLLAHLGRRMGPHAGRKSRWNDARRFLSALDLDPLPRYLAWRSLFSADGLAALLAPDFAQEALGDDPTETWRGALAGLEDRPWLDRAMAVDLADYLPNDCLAKVDIASMRHSLEVRSPMLDHRVVELARRMPVHLKWRRRAGRLPQGKAVLREAMADLLPAGILGRGKMGFGVPVSRWLAGDYADWMRGILLDPRTVARGLTQRRAVEAMIAAHTALRADHGERLWALLCLELWFRAFGIPC